MRTLISTTYRYPQEGRWNGRPIGACVLRRKQLFEFALQIGGPPILCGRVERVHRRAIVVPELVDILGR